MKIKKIKRIDNNKNIFDDLSDEWWNPKGPFGTLHRYNFVRIAYIKELLEVNKFKLRNLRILDVGCGGGILTEPLSRLGAKVTGIDTNKKAINVAKEHAKKNNLQISYYNTSISEFMTTNKFDLITCMEVLEHVENINLIIKEIKRLLKKKGIFCGSTINKTYQSYILAIIVAENILKLLPKKTHEWEKFIKPSFLKKNLFLSGFVDFDLKGVIYNPLTKSWKFSRLENINYLFSSILK